MGDVTASIGVLFRGLIMHVEKEVIRPGEYYYKDQSTGLPCKLKVTPEMTKYWCEQGNKMLSDGLTVPVPLEHDFNAHPMTAAEKLKANAGWVTKYELRGDRLYTSLDIQDEEVHNKLPTTIKWTSPWINSFTDGNGKEWKNVISHLALTARPRIIEQEPFKSVAMALSDAIDVTANDTTEKGFYLSRSLELTRDDDGNTLPKYPIAFSLATGIPMATDAHGREHDAQGKFTSKGGGAKKSDGRKAAGAKRRSMNDLRAKMKKAKESHAYHKKIIDEKSHDVGYGESHKRHLKWAEDDIAKHKEAWKQLTGSDWQDDEPKEEKGRGFSYATAKRKEKRAPTSDDWAINRRRRRSH